MQEVHTRQQVAATRCGEMSQQQITPSVMAHFCKNFVLATRLNLCDLFGYVSCDSFTKVLVSIPGLFPKLARQGAEKLTKYAFHRYPKHTNTSAHASLQMHPVKSALTCNLTVVQKQKTKL